MASIAQALGAEESEPTTRLSIFVPSHTKDGDLMAMTQRNALRGLVNIIFNAFGGCTVTGPHAGYWFDGGTLHEDQPFELVFFVPTSKVTEAAQSLGKCARALGRSMKQASVAVTVADRMYFISNFEEPA